jgi:hypothetical protein
MYLQKKFDLTIESVLAPPTIEMNDPAAIRKFIENLKIALQSSQRSGGLYSAFAYTKNDGVLRVMVQTPIRVKGSS